MTLEMVEELLRQLVAKKKATAPTKDVPRFVLPHLPYRGKQ